MPIVNLQRQMRELGRIRTGNQVAGGRGKRPNKLETFRLTSDSEALIAAAAKAYGGVVVPWDNNGHPEFEVITTAAAMDIVVPPGQPVSQWYELWSAGGCLRRCDGNTNVLDMSPCGSSATMAGDQVIPPCPQETAQRVEAAAKGKACKATTRLNVILPLLPDLGVWRLESHGFYAAVELAGAAEILAMASEHGLLIPARLRLDQREKKIPGKPTRQYAVPIIEFVETRFAALGIVAPPQLEGGAPQMAAGATSGRPQLGTGAAGRPALPSTTPPASSDFRAPGPVESTENTGDESDGEFTEDGAPAAMTFAEFKEASAAAGIDRDVALARSIEMFPRERGVPLNDEQRAALFADLTAPAVVL